jgi:hypothetical protein
MADDGHFAQAARAWCAKALARLLPDLDRGASCPVFKRTPSVKQLFTGVIKWGDANFAFPQLRRLSGHTS